VQPLAAPPRRGLVLAIVLLVVGFLASTSVAIVEFVQLREAREEIEDLEARLAEGGGGGGGLFGDLGEIFEDAFGELGESLGGGTAAGELVGCLFPEEPFSSPPIRDAGIDQQVDAIADQVERIRRLEFTEPVDPEFVSPEESAGRVQELFLAEYTEAIGDAESRLLTALGAIPPGTDMRSLRAELLGQQVAGFYDPETGELVVRQVGGELTLTDRVVLAHELDHALTDQVLELPVPDDIRTGREDADLAVTALVEGDATLLMQLYSASLPIEEQFQGLDPSAFTEAIQAQADLADLPPYLSTELTFPYEEGLRFVCDLYTEGGWEAVNQAYRDPPDSTVEVLVPELYRDGFEPVDPRDPGPLGRTWRRTATMQLGAAPLLWLLQAPGGRDSRGLPEARAAAQSWAGGELELWTRGADSAVGISLAERPGQDRLCLSMQEWYGSSVEGDRERGTPDGAFEADGDRQDAVIDCPADEVRIGLAPDLHTARMLAR
jgi:hypothetical protein